MWHGPLSQRPRAHSRTKWESSGQPKWKMEIFKLLHKVTTSSGRGSLLLNCAVDASTSTQECTLGSGRQFRSTYAGPLLSQNTQKGDWQWGFGKKKSFSQALTRKRAYFCCCFDLQLCITATLLMWYIFLVQLGENPSQLFIIIMDIAC